MSHTSVCCFILNTAIFLAACAACALAAEPSGAELLRVQVSGFRSAVTDWVQHADLDLTELAALRGLPADAALERVSVRELDATGRPGARCLASCASHATRAGAGTLFWRMDGDTPAGATRTFALGLEQGATEAGRAAEVVRVRREGDRIVVTNRWYEVVHDVRKGGTIVEILYRSSGKKVAVAMRDGMRAREWHYLCQDEQPVVTVLGGSEGALGAVVEVRGRLVHPATPSAACPQVTYRYTYAANSPLVHIAAVIPAQAAAQRFSQVQQFVFEYPGQKPFHKTDRIVPSGKGTLMVTRFEWSPDEHRPPAGFLMSDGTNALALLNPVSGTFRLDAEAGHLASRGFVETWQGERLALDAVLCIAPVSVVETFIPLADGVTVRAAVPTVRDRIAGLQARLGPATPPAQRQAAAMLLKAAQQRVEAVRGLQEAAELLTAAEALLVKTDNASPCVVETNSFIGLANAFTGLLFRRRNPALSLDGLFRGEHAFLQPAWEGRPLWRASWKAGDGWAGSTSLEAEQVTCRVSRSPRDVRLNVEWPSVKAGAERVRARAAITLAADDPLSRWTLALHPDGQKIGLWEVVFPVVGGIARDGDATDFLVFPYKSGTSVPNPAAAGVWDAQYPGAAGWQFLAYWQGRDGLYVATHDSGAAVKKLGSLPQAGRALELRMTHPVPNMGLPGTGVELPFESVIGAFEGDWYDATQIYRAWLVKQPWFPKQPLHANPDIPRWLKDCCVATRRSGSAENFLRNFVEKHASGFQEWHTGVTEEHEALGRPPTLLWWYHAWFPKEGRQDHFNDSPDFPPVPDFRDGVAELQRMGIRVAGYTLAHWWGYETASWKQEGAEKAVCLRPDGSPDLYTRRGVGVMCPATKLYQEKMQRVLLGVLSDGPVDGTYFDLGGTSGASYCHATHHGHPAGSGEFITAGKRALLRGMRTAARTRNPEFILIMEGDADCYLDAVDGFALFEENVPLRIALYADYLRSAGSKRTNWERKPMEAIVSAKQLAWGALIGRFVSSEMNKGKDLDPAKAAHFRNLVRHKLVARPWLNYGRMLRPLAITDVDPPEPSEFVEGTLVPTGVWQAPDGTVAFVFVNARCADEVSFRWTLRPAAYGLPADGSLTLHRLTPEGETPTPRFEPLAALRGPLERREKLPPSGALILVALSPGGV